MVLGTIYVLHQERVGSIFVISRAQQCPNATWSFYIRTASNAPTGATIYSESNITKTNAGTETGVISINSNKHQGERLSWSLSSGDTTGVTYKGTKLMTDSRLCLFCIKY